MKDFYQILEIDKNASGDEIKSAFRKKAMKYHPDKNPDDKEAEEKFKEINEAYETLSDPVKKQHYDIGPEYHSADMNDFGFSQHDFFKDFFNNKFLSVLQGMLILSVEEAYKGCKKDIFINGMNHSIDIPARTPKGKQFLLQISGNEKLVVNIDIQDEDEYKVQGIDLHTNVKIFPHELVLGCKKIINLFGEKASITIPGGISSIQKIRIKERGFSGEAGRFGDLYFQITVDTPKISDEIIELYKKIKELNNDSK